MREIKDIKLEIQKVSEAKRVAYRKIYRCDKRLEELDDELSIASGMTGSSGKTDYYFETKNGFVIITSKNLNLATLEFEASHPEGYLRRMTRAQYQRMIDGGEE